MTLLAVPPLPPEQVNTMRVIDGTQRVAAGAKKAETPKQPARRPQVDLDPEAMAKLIKTLGDEAVAAMRDMQLEELRSYVISLADHEVEIEQSQKKDVELERLREQLKQAAAPYRDALKGVKARRQFAVLLAAERGRSLTQG